MMVYKPEDFPVSVNEVAEILNVEPATVSTWKSRKLMPKVDALLNKGTTRVWRIQTIIEWANATGRNPQRLSIDQAFRSLIGETRTDNEDQNASSWDSIGSFNE